MNRKLQGQVAAVGGVGQWDLQGSKDILGQFNVECRAGTQSSQIQRCGSQFLGSAPSKGEREDSDAHIPGALRGIKEIDTGVKGPIVAVHKIGNQHRRSSTGGGRDLLQRIGAIGEVGGEDLSGTSHTSRLNLKLQGQIAAVGGVGEWDQ